MPHDPFLGHDRRKPQPPPPPDPGTDLLRRGVVALEGIEKNTANQSGGSNAELKTILERIEDKLDVLIEGDQAAINRLAARLHAKSAALKDATEHPA